MLRVATWNVNSVNARLERLLKFLARAKPDVVCLQELKCVDEKFPLDAIRQAGYFAAIHGQKAYNGVAVLSRIEPTDVSRGMEDAACDSTSRLLGVTVKGVRIYSAYIPNGQAVGTEKYSYKLEWLKRLKHYLTTRHTVREKLLLAGDFNVAPEDRDVYDPDAWRGQVLFSDPEKAALGEICAFGLQDTFRKHHREGGLYSWWDYRQLGFQKNRGLRIDFILATPALWETCVSASIDRDERKGVAPSDHAPVIAEFAVTIQP